MRNRTHMRPTEQMTIEDLQAAGLPVYGPTLNRQSIECRMILERLNALVHCADFISRAALLRTIRDIARGEHLK
jgi:hypothetical protein